MARSATDLAAILSQMVGYDSRDPWAIAYPETMPNPDDSLSRDIKGLRIGVPTTFFFEAVDREIEFLVRSAADVFAILGAEVTDIALPCDESICQATATIIRSDALALHRERYDTHPELLGEEIRQRFELGASIPGDAVSRAHLAMREWQRTVRQVFDHVDIILTPTTTIVAPKIAAADSINTTWNLTYLTYPWSLAHLPALSIPCGFTNGALPVGVQLTAKPLRDPLLLRAAARYQEITAWHLRRPEVLRSASR
jgi:aspartyl-tRNA(Asn)/glutamyl-tRNA(Gln) amidotransferase subunit A